MNRRSVLITFFLVLYIVPMIFSGYYVGTTTPTEQNTGKEFSLSYEDWYSGTSFTYRQLFTVTKSPDYVPDAPESVGYAINITVPYNANMQADFDDLFFTLDDGVTPTAFWIENYTDSTSADIWLKLYSGSVSGSYYMYYGNSTVTSASSGTDTFLFFDDFENNNLNRWYDAGAYWSTVSDRVLSGSYSAFGDANTVLDGRYLSENLTSRNSDDLLIHFWAQAELQAPKQIICRSYNTSAGTLDALVMDTYLFYDNGPYLQWSATTISADTWNEFEIAIDYTNLYYRFWWNKTLIGFQDLEDASGVPITSVDSWDIIVASSAGQDLWLDNCYVRIWTLNEPVFNSWGAIQNVTDSAEWNIVDSIIVYIEVPFDYWALNMGLIFGGLILMLVAACLMAVKIRDRTITRDAGILLLFLFCVGWGLFIGGAVIG